MAKIWERAAIVFVSLVGIQYHRFHFMRTATWWGVLSRLSLDTTLLGVLAIVTKECMPPRRDHEATASGPLSPFLLDENELALNPLEQRPR